MSMDILNQFGINPILLLAQVVNFAILLFILKRFLYKPILKVLAERKKKIAESLQNAEEIERRLTAISEREAEAVLKSAKEGEKIIKQATEYAAQIIDEGSKKSEEIINKAYEEAAKVMQLEKVKLQQEVKENLADIVALVLKKVTGQVISEKKQKEIIEKEVRNLS